LRKIKARRRARPECGENKDRNKQIKRQENHQFDGTRFNFVILLLGVNEMDSFKFKINRQKRRNLNVKLLGRGEDESI
jgi:hypothetical protein